VRSDNAAWRLHWAFRDLLIFGVWRVIPSPREMQKFP
jgi:hypothetical protein